MESLNRMAIELVDEALDFAAELDIGAYELDNEATVLDFGVEFDGGVESGLLLTEIQTGGLASVSSRVEEVAGAPLPVVDCASDHPALALLCAQKASWEVSTDSFEGLGSGPARALVAEEEEFRKLGYADDFDLTVLAVESGSLPDESVAEQVAELTGLPTSSVFLAAFPTASVVGSVTMAARAAELATFRLSELGYPLESVVSAAGSAPVAPVPASEEAAMARTNDALAYGGRAHVVVRKPVDDPEAIASSAAEAYGRPFLEIFEAVDWAFEELPTELFAPAQVTVDVLGGPTHVVGERREDLLAESFDL